MSDLTFFSFEGFVMMMFRYSQSAAFEIPRSFLYLTVSPTIHTQSVPLHQKCLITKIHCNKILSTHIHNAK